MKEGRHAQKSFWVDYTEVWNNYGRSCEDADGFLVWLFVWSGDLCGFINPWDASNSQGCRVAVQESGPSHAAGMAYSKSTSLYPKPGIACPRAGGTSSSRIIGHLALIIVIQLLVMVPPSKSEGKYTFWMHCCLHVFVWNTWDVCCCWSAQEETNKSCCNSSSLQQKLSAKQFYFEELNKQKRGKIVSDWRMSNYKG